MRGDGQEGFTLVELLVTLAIALIVLAATLNALDVFSSDSQAMTQRNTAQNDARLAVDRIVRQLRNIAAPFVSSPKLVQRATPYDLVFETVGASSSADPQGIQWSRYCIPQDTAGGSAGSEVLLTQTEPWTATSQSVPWGSNCPDPASPAMVLAGGVTNRYRGQDHPVFTYRVSPLDDSTIDRVGVDLLVNPTPWQADAQTELQSAAFLRNQQRPPVANFTYTPLGGGAVLLNAGTSYDPNGQTLSYSWTCTGAVPCSSSAAVFSWKPGPNTYTVTLTVTEPSGLSSPPISHQVTVS